jgi:hypothetical protein
MTFRFVPIPMPKILTIFLAAALLESAVAHGATMEELRDQLNNEVARSLQFGEDKGDQKTSQEDVGQVAELQKALNQNEFEQARQLLDSLQKSSLPPAAEKLVGEMQSALPDYAKETKAKFIVQANAAVQTAGDKCLAAKKEGELDEILKELVSLRKNRLDQSDEANESGVSQKIMNAEEFVRQWQQYLRLRSAGYREAANRILQVLAQNPSDFPVVPYAKLVERIGAGDGKGGDSPVEQILKTVKSPEDLPPALEKIRNLPPDQSLARFGYGISFPPAEYLRQLSDALQSGRYDQALRLTGSGSSSSSGEALRIETMLAQVVIRHYLAPDQALSLKPGENISAAIEVLATADASHGDWRAVAQALDLLKSFAFASNEPAWLHDALASSRAYVAGETLEAEELFPAAVEKYEWAVLQGSGKLGAGSDARKKLDALKKEHPAEFEAGRKAINGAQ